MEPLKVPLKKYLIQAITVKVYTKFKKSHWSLSTVKLRTVFSGFFQSLREFQGRAPDQSHSATSVG